MVIAVAIGVALRFVNLDLKPFWEDEIYSITRVSGYTRLELEAQLHNRVVTATDLKAFRTPGLDTTWSDTMRALASVPEHPPLYFLLLRLWVQGFGSSVATLRALTAVLSVVILGALWGAARSLFGSVRIAWATVAVAAVSPIMVRYAQETRQYGLWLLLTILSTWALSRAVRGQEAKQPTLGLVRLWAIYGATTLLLFYTHLLSFFVVAAQGIGVLWNSAAHAMNRRTDATGSTEPKVVWSTLWAYGLANAIALVGFLPWLVRLFDPSLRVGARTNWLAVSLPWKATIWLWLQKLSHVWLSLPRQLWEQPTFWWSSSLAVVIVILLSLWLVLRHGWTGRLVVALATMPWLMMIVIDLLAGGQRSTLGRYLLPSFVGMIFAIGGAIGGVIENCSDHATAPWRRRTIEVGTVIFLWIGVVSSAHLTMQPYWWGLDRNTSEIAHEIARHGEMTVVTDYRISKVLSIAFFLPKRQPILWLDHARLGEVALPKGALLTFKPSEALQAVLAKQRPGQEPELIAQIDENTLYRYAP